MTFGHPPDQSFTGRPGHRHHDPFSHWVTLSWYWVSRSLFYPIIVPSIRVGSDKYQFDNKYQFGMSLVWLGLDSNCATFHTGNLCSYRFSHHFRSVCSWWNRSMHAGPGAMQSGATGMLGTRRCVQTINTTPLSPHNLGSTELPLDRALHYLSDSSCLLRFYILTTSKVISVWVSACDRAHSWWLYSAASWPD